MWQPPPFKTDKFSSCKGSWKGPYHNYNLLKKTTKLKLLCAENLPLHLFHPSPRK